MKYSTMLLASMLAWVACAANPVSESSALTLPVSSKDTATGVTLFQSGTNVDGICYYKMTMKKGQKCTIWLEGRSDASVAIVDIHAQESWTMPGSTFSQTVYGSQTRWVFTGEDWSDDWSFSGDDWGDDWLYGLVRVVVANDVTTQLATVHGVALVVTTPNFKRNGCASDGIPVEGKLAVRCIELPAVNRVPGHLTALDAAEIVAHKLEAPGIEFDEIDQTSDARAGSVTATVNFNCCILLTI